jgi:succinate dehydrogenase hydrophobic anchor subunit
MNTMNRTVAGMLRIGMKWYRQIATGVAVVAIVVGLVNLLGEDRNATMSASATITQEFSGVYNGAMLVEFCYRLQGLNGVTAVTVKKWQPERQAATITVYYNATKLSAQQIKVFLYNSKIIWTEPLST